MPYGSYTSVSCFRPIPTPSHNYLTSLDGNQGGPSLLRRPAWLAILLFVLCVTALYPIGLDTSVYQSMAIEFVKFGRPPYLGSADQNLPGGMLVQLISVLLFGTSELAYRLVDLLFLVVTSIVLYSIWSKYLRAQAAFIAVLLYDFYLIRGGTSILGQRDVYAGVLVIAAAAIAIGSIRQASRMAIFSGLLIGFAVLIRPTYILYAPLLPLTIAALRSPKPIFILLLSCILPTATIVGLYSTIPGAISEIYRMTILANADLYTKFGGPFKWFILNVAYLPSFIAIPALLWAASKRLRTLSLNSIHREPARNEWYLYAGYFLLTLLLILIQRKFLPYHFAPYALLLTPLAALGIESVLSFIRWKIRLTAVVFGGIAICWPIGALYTAARTSSSPSTFLESFGQSIDPDSNVGYRYQHEALAYLNSPAYQNKRIEVIGFDARLRALLARRSPTRFTQIHLIGYRTDPDAPESEALHPEYQRRWRKEFVDSLRNSDAIVIASHTHSWYLRDPDQVLHTLPGFDSLLASDFLLDTTIGGFQIYARVRTAP